MVNWTHSGFSIDASIRIPAGSTETRQALAQYIVRPPVSLQKLLVDQGGTDTEVYRAPCSDYFHSDMEVFPAIEFLVEVLQHLPPPPRSRGLEARPSTPVIRPHPSSRRAAARAVGVGQAEPRRMGPPDQEGLRGGPLSCPRCHKPMKVIAVIIDPAQVLKILRHLIKNGTPPPGLDPASLN